MTFPGLLALVGAWLAWRGDWMASTCALALALFFMHLDRRPPPPPRGGVR